MAADTANISTPEQNCLRECSRTFAVPHGDALPGGPFPGTAGEPGDVRRCEHGRVWQWTSRWLWRIDLWEPLSPWWTPVRYRRAVRALTAPSSSVDEGNPTDG